jgi:integrase
VKTVLTDELIARLRPSEKNQPFYDGKQTGLVLRITPADNRSWFAVARPKGATNPVWKKFGEWPELRVREARHAVLPALTEIGKIPATKEEDDPGEPWEVMAERYLDWLHRLDPNGKPVVRSADYIESTIRRFLIEPWRGVPGKKITRKMVVPVLTAHLEVRPNPLYGQKRQKRIIGGAFACRNLYIIAHAIFEWLADPPAKVSLSPFIPSNPVPSNGENIHGLSGEDLKRKVWLDRPSKLVAVWHAAGVMIEEGAPGASLFGRLTRIALADGQRRSQFAKLRRDQVEDGTLWFGRDEMKENVEHVLPLTTYIEQELSELPIINDSPYYFTVKGRVPFCSFGYQKRLRQLSGVTDFTTHDLRRTMRSWLSLIRLPNGRRIDRDVRELILAHSRPGMEGVYDVTTALEFQPEMREALECWQNHLLGLAAQRATTCTSHR